MLVLRMALTVFLARGPSVLKPVSMSAVSHDTNFTAWSRYDTPDPDDPEMVCYFDEREDGWFCLPYVYLRAGIDSEDSY